MVSDFWQIASPLIMGAVAVAVVWVVGRIWKSVDDRYNVAERIGLAKKNLLDKDYIRRLFKTHKAEITIGVLVAIYVFYHAINWSVFFSTGYANIIIPDNIDVSSGGFSGRSEAVRDMAWYFVAVFLFGLVMSSITKNKVFRYLLIYASFTTVFGGSAVLEARAEQSKTNKAIVSGMLEAGKKSLELSENSLNEAKQAEQERRPNGEWVARKQSQEELDRSERLLGKAKDLNTSESGAGGQAIFDKLANYAFFNAIGITSDDLSFTKNVITAVFFDLSIYWSGMFLLAFIGAVFSSIGEWLDKGQYQKKKTDEVGEDRKNVASSQGNGSAGGGSTPSQIIPADGIRKAKTVSLNLKPAQSFGNPAAAKKAMIIEKWQQQLVEFWENDTPPNKAAIAREVNALVVANHFTKGCTPSWVKAVIKEWNESHPDFLLKEMRNLKGHVADLDAEKIMNILKLENLELAQSYLDKVS